MDALSFICRPGVPRLGVYARLSMYYECRCRCRWRGISRRCGQAAGAARSRPPPRASRPARSVTRLYFVLQCSYKVTAGVSPRCRRVCGQERLRLYGLRWLSVRLSSPSLAQSGLRWLVCAMWGCTPCLSCSSLSACHAWLDRMDAVGCFCSALLDPFQAHVEQEGRVPVWILDD